MTSIEFEPAIPASETPQTHVLNVAATNVHITFNENLLIITKNGKNLIEIISLILLQICPERSLTHPLQFILGRVKKCFCSPEPSASEWI